MKNIFIALLIATTLSSCLNFAVRALAYPKWKPHYEIQDGQVFYLCPNAAGGSRLFVKGADPQSFEQLSDEWGKDKNSVYYAENKIKQYDAGSFQLLAHGFVCDKSSIYRNGWKQAGDPGTVIVFSKHFYMDQASVRYTRFWRDEKDNRHSIQKKIKSETYLRSMGASEALVNKIRRERSKRGWIPLPR
ncbi:hypothetical protein CSB45_15545 [candidate division KSB3 bacterium]|uniref:Lipoprotein n=1 Tax=candidate division KSB3 bacterium TaxID=2044937 RepID=A0A2G6E0U6_9BACT|nr:MAG: hypothetical protein CSB45_15545 [candidate division KSB3 bacterium]